MRRRIDRQLSGKPRRRAGFSLVEIMVVITIISLLASMGLPQVRKAQRRTKASAVANDIRTFSSAFETYAQERGAWPAEVAAGVLPPEMAGHLNATAWLRVTPIGGQYNWDANQTHSGIQYRAVISISETASAPFPVNAELLLEIDRLMDDGNLSTGNMRIGVNNDPIFILQQ